MTCALAGLVAAGGVLGVVVSAQRLAPLASYSTSLSGRSPEQLQNIREAAWRLDGAVVAPGAEFSFNRCLGPRTLRGGYAAAPAYRSGRLLPEEGGGICQVSSTVYNAARLAGLQVTERHPHSGPVSSVGPGLDATVSYPDKDLRFRNRYLAPIRLRISVSAERLIVAITGPLAPGKTTGSGEASGRRLRAARPRALP